MADTIRSAFQFVHGAAGKTWREHGDAWLEEIEQWLADGPLAPHAHEIMSHLRRARPEPMIDAGAVRDFLAQHPEARRLVVYGLGRNGAILLEQLRAAAWTDSVALCAADDSADPLVFLSHELERDDPRHWKSWPDWTLAIVTPNEYREMCATLRRAGGRAGTDFIVMTQCGRLHRTPPVPEVTRA